MTRLSSVRPELVEGPLSSFHRLAGEGRGFDKLSPNGVGVFRDHEVLA